MEQTNTTKEEDVKKKRGRKPSQDKKNYYFSVSQEKGVVDYLASDDAEEKNKIFNSILKPAFSKMIDAIIRRYNLYVPDEEFQETFNDTISFLMTKLSCFDPTTNYKAYSYCGTICKNYLIYKINQHSKSQKRSVSYDNPFDTLQNDLSDNINYSYDDNDPKNNFLIELTGATVKNIEKIISDKDKFKLTDNEVKVGSALINLIKNWDELFAQMGSNKFNKSSILLFLKETTMLNTKEIRDSMKVFKRKYYEVKKNLVNE